MNGKIFLSSTLNRTLRLPREDGKHMRQGRGPISNITNRLIKNNTTNSLNQTKVIITAIFNKGGQLKAISVSISSSNSNRNNISSIRSNSVISMHTMILAEIIMDTTLSMVPRRHPRRQLMRLQQLLRLLRRMRITTITDRIEPRRRSGVGQIRQCPIVCGLTNRIPTVTGEVVTTTTTGTETPDFTGTSDHPRHLLLPIAVASGRWATSVTATLRPSLLAIHKHTNAVRRTQPR
mmetsp:Transcript_49829/g.120753  ORF Transcript_49829/g.120753 Transcript_49829/m.120753 type:complete len:235 (+) Transcript_49829:1249-1953(+)